MIVIPSSNKVHPLVVAGLGRSGTRFVTNLLNAHQHVTLQGEIPNGVFGEIKQLFHLLDRHYGNGRNRPENPRRQKEIWEAKKREMVFAVWAFGGQDPIVRIKPRTRYFDYKRPGHEEYFEFYSRIFAPVEAYPVVPANQDVE
ncbi:sulfotransferase [Parvibaculum sp.]|uniref:sulfotransferase n=1 Tax=Parvibaculum sp. TaxID=2024848 RepID=UPI00391A5B44